MTLETPGYDLGEISTKASILIEALPYIRNFASKVIVIKYGGNAISDGDEGSEEDVLRSFAQDIVLLHSVGLRPIVVHGGGPQIEFWLKKLGKKTSFHDGLRVTDAETLEIVRMVLLGRLNPDIVAQINLHGALGVGVSGADAAMVHCKKLSDDLGFVGEVTTVNAEILARLLHEGLIPVVASIGVDEIGQAYNINADHVASAIAGALQAEKLVYLTNVEGVRRDLNSPESLIRQVQAPELADMIERGVISGGMIPKVRSALEAIAAGVGSVHFLDGRLSHALLLEIFTDQGIGTMIYG